MHAAMLIAAVYMLNKRSISPDDIKKSTNLLVKFHQCYCTLYGIRNSHFKTRCNYITLDFNFNFPDTQKPTSPTCLPQIHTKLYSLVIIILTGTIFFSFSSHLLCCLLYMYDSRTCSTGYAQSMHSQCSVDA